MKAGLSPILFVLVVSVTAVVVQSQIIHGPVNALKNVNDSVTLECVTSSKNCDQVEWKKMEGAQSARTVYSNGIMLNGFHGERYSVNSTGGCNLTIRDLQVNDSGRFSCVLHVGDREETKGSVLVVIAMSTINGKEASTEKSNASVRQLSEVSGGRLSPASGVRELLCQSSTSNNELTEGDVYSFWTAINVPAKSVEPSNVTLYFQNKTADETETMDDSQPLTVKTTLIGIARKENIMPRVFRVSFSPNTAADFDRSTATLDVCTTHQFNVSSVQSKIENGPANALKKVGDSVTLECVTSSQNCDNVEWKKMEGAQSARTVYSNGVMLNGFHGERYSVNSTGGCNLIIRELEIKDSGRFSCMLAVGNREETRSSILFVIGVIESCMSNVTSNALNQNDSYSLWTAINVPAKSVEPSNVILSFENKIVGETETLDDSQPQTAKTTLIGIAKKENITQRVFRASLTPNTATGFDNSTATLNVCSTHPLIVSYPVESVTASPSGLLHINTTDGYPSSTVELKPQKSGEVANDTLRITCKTGDEYTCTATNTVNGKTTSMTITFEVDCPPKSGFETVYEAVIAVLVIIIVIMIVVVWLVGWKLDLWRFCFCLICCWKKNEKKSCKFGSAAQLLNEKPPTDSSAAQPLNEKPPTNSSAAQPLNEKPLTNSSATWPRKPPRQDV